MNKNIAPRRRQQHVGVLSDGIWSAHDRDLRDNGVPTSTRKPGATRTCCDTHTDTCRFGRDHLWSSPWLGGSRNGIAIGEDGWHDSMMCASCKGICVADMEEGGRA